MAKQPDDLIFTAPVPPEQGGYPGFNPRTEKARGMIIEYDVAVPMRDGATIYVDVYRPDAPGTYPAAHRLGSVRQARAHPLRTSGQHRAQGRGLQRVHQVRGGRPGLLVRATATRSSTPIPRGTWACEGDLTWMSEQEVEDIYDLIEWAGTREWSNGKVGMHGRLLSGLEPVEGGGGQPAAPGGHQSLGGRERLLPRAVLPRRHPRDAVLRHVAGRTSTSPPPGSRTCSPCRSCILSTTTTGPARTPTSPR